MATLRWFLAGTLMLAACGNDTGATGVDAGPQDAGDSTIAPLDAADAFADAVGDAATDVAADIQTDVPPELAPDVPQDIAPDAIADSADDVAADVAPDIAPDIATDSNGDAFVAEMCSGGFPGSGYCADGLLCWTYPCPKCGAMPTGFCVPPLTGGGCYDYTNCNGGECVNAQPMSGVAGWCLAAINKAGSCWPDASAPLPDCYPGSTCEGAFICPPMGACPKADSPGTCKPAAEQKDKVYLWQRSGGIVSPGENVTVTWVNNTGASIFLGGCGTYNIQNTTDYKTWTDLGPGVMCIWEGVAVEVPAGGYFNTTSWQGPNNSVGNYRFEGSYSIGCTPGKPLSQAGCSASTIVDSDTFFVGAAP